MHNNVHYKKAQRRLHKKEAEYLKVLREMQQLNDKRYDLGQEIDKLAKEIRTWQN